jgi:CRP/FNR family transcriptional regulator, cyclic AMP receptor protein
MRKALYFLGVLDDADMEWLTRSGESRHLEAGSTIIVQGKPVDSFFIVLSGELKVYSKDLEIARLQSGEIVGEISFVDSRPPLASVKALINSNVFAINAELLRAKLAKDSSFASRFYRAVAIFLADRLRVTTSRFGYGQLDQDGVEAIDADELHPELLESIDLAATRFDKLLRGISARF